MEESFDKPRIGLARDLARKLLKQANIGSYPIKLKDIAKLIPDLIIDGEELEDEISGMQASYKGISFIRYNSSHPTKRKRFTVAHELGHAVMGHTSQCNKSDFVSRNPQEIEANQFAAELLTPLALLKKATDSLKTVDQLARAFWVSKDSMNWRVMETGLFSKLSSWN